MNVQSAPTQKLEYSPPPPNGDFYRIADVLDDGERATVKRVRQFMDDEVTPIIADYWVRDKFPFEIISTLTPSGTPPKC